MAKAEANSEQSDVYPVAGLRPNPDPVSILLGSQVVVSSGNRHVGGLRGGVFVGLHWDSLQRDHGARAGNRVTDQLEVNVDDLGSAWLHQAYP